MQSVWSDVEKILGWLDDIPSVARSAGVSRSFWEASRQAKHTHLKIKARNDVVDGRRAPSLVDIVQWMRRKHKQLAELSSVDIRTQHGPTRLVPENYLVTVGMMLQLLYDARPIHMKITPDLLYSRCNIMPDSVKDLTVVARKDTEEQVDLSTTSHLFPQLERLVISHAVFFIEEGHAPQEQLRYLQMDSLVAESAVDIDFYFPALEELTYIIYTDSDDHGLTISCINELLRHSTLRKAHFTVHSSVTKPLVFEVPPDSHLKLTVDRHAGAPKVGFRSPTKWH